MKLSRAEKEALLGPVVVGCLLGAFAAFGVVAMDDEQRLSGIAVACSHTAMEALVYFICCAAGTVAVLGVLPILMHRHSSTGGRDA
jgi:hypothetical protein